MKKYLFLLTLPLLLTSCGNFENNFYGKSYSYQGGSVYNLDVEVASGKTIKSIIVDAFNSNNVDPTTSGGVNSGLFSREIVPFEKCGNYNEVISSMESLAKVSFDNAYKGGLSFTVGTKEDKKFTLKKGNEVFNWKFKEYNDNDTYLQLLDGDKTRGHISVLAVPGQGFYNGKCSCVDLELDGTRSRLTFTVGFKQEVTLDGEKYSGVDWTVYAKIN